MDQIENLGIVIVIYLQGLTPGLVHVMRGISYLGIEQFFLFVAPVVYWCIDASIGLRIGLGLMISNSLNSMLKLLFHAPRPYWYSSEVKAFSSETSFGFPSAHSQNAVVVWGLLAYSIKRRWIWIVAIVTMLLIGISRMFLGVHFPHDVLLGWLIGFVILWAFIKLEKPVYTWMVRKSYPAQIGIAFCASMVIVLLGVLARQSLTGWNLPETWVTNAAHAAPQAEPIAPLQISGLVSNAGVLFGLAWGALWLKRKGWFDATGTFWKRVLRFLIGILGVFLLWMGLGAVFPQGDTALSLFLRYFRYFLVGIWVAGLAPVLFIRLKIAEKME